MSKRYIGGLITKNPTVPTTSAAPGIWTLDQALYYIKAGTWPVFQLAVEDVFNTYLYTGNGGTQTFTNGVDLAGNGGLVWIKQRSAGNHSLFDTVRGGEYWLGTHTTIPQQLNTLADGRITSFNNNGFTLGTGGGNQTPNGINYTQVAWSFREAPNFFDIVSYVGDGTTGRVISHNLGSAPGMIVIKAVSASSNWFVYHRSTADMGLMNATDSFSYSNRITSVTSSSFTVTSSNAGVGATNVNGVTYVAYLYGHNTASNGFIQCGTFTTDSSGNATVNLGWEPQWFLTKSTGAGSWLVADNMRGLPADGSWNLLFPNTTDAEGASGNVTLTSTGINLGKSGDFSGLSPNVAYIYVAIRRGPMRTPTIGTSVFNVVLTNASVGTTVTVGFPSDSHWANFVTGDGANTTVFDRLRGLSSVAGTNSPNNWLATATTGAQSTAAGAAGYLTGVNNTGWVQGPWASAGNSVRYDFRRAPGFFDQVCFSGQNTEITLNHNLGVAPELIIVKTRTPAGYDWYVQSSALASATASYLVLNKTDAVGTSAGFWGSVAPTATQFRIGGGNNANSSGRTYVSYLFATCPGVSKVGTYTGTAALQTINCGFTTGARFILIKRTDSTSNWFLWDSARGISSGTDPYLFLNTTAAETTGANFVDTTATGFQVTAAASSTVNVSGATYIFLAIA